MADNYFPFTSAPPNYQAGGQGEGAGQGAGADQGAGAGQGGYRGAGAGQGEYSGAGAGQGVEQYLHHQAVGYNHYQQPRGYPYHAALPARDVLQQQGGARGRGGGGWLPDGMSHRGVPPQHLPGGFYRSTNFGGGQLLQNQTFSREIEFENAGLRQENSQCISRIRSQEAEIDQLRAELEWAKKENIKVKETSANAQDQLIALKSESSRRILEYEEEIVKVTEREKRWRLKVQKLKSDMCKRSFEASIEKKYSASDDAAFGFFDEGGASDDMNKEETEEEAVFNSDVVADGKTETNGAISLKPDDDTEILITNAKEDERMVVEATEGNNNDEDGDMTPVKRQRMRKRNMPRPSQRQVQISYLQGRSYLSPAELRKLGNLLEQEVLWNSNQLGGVKDDFKSSKKSKTKALNSKRDLQEKFKPDFVERASKGAEETVQKVPLATMEERFPDPEDQERIRSLPQRKDPVFEIIPGSIPFAKNYVLSRLLHSGKDPEKLIKLVKATPENFKSLTGQEFDCVKLGDGRKDSIDDLSLHVKSDSWMKQLGTIYRRIASFVDEYSEFR